MIRRTRLLMATAAALAALSLATACAVAADVVVQPKTGSGLVVTDASGSQIRLRVNENGEVTIPVLINGAQQNLPACVSATGQLGPCAPGAVGSLALPYAGNTAVADAAFAVTNSANGDSVVGVSTDGVGVRGTSVSNDGVYGHTTAAAAAGVEGSGENNSVGVLGGGKAGPGVKGFSDSGYAIVADGATQQRLSQGGWVKAMVQVQQGPLGIFRCFNSQLPASGSSAAPCGFKLRLGGTGTSDIDFGFPVYDRFVSATINQACYTCVINISAGSNGNSLHIQVFDSQNGPFVPANLNYYLIVY